MPLDQAPDIDLLGAAPSYNEDDPALLIAPTATLVDPDSDFHAGSLRVSIDAGGTADDVLAIVDQGTGTGEIGVNGTDVTYEGTLIGSFAGGTGGSDLVVTFTSGASVEAVQALARDVSFFYFNTGTLDTTDRHVTFAANDGDGQSDSDGATIHVSASPHAPALHQPYTTAFADDSTDFFSLNISRPTDADGGPLLITVTDLPAYGQVGYFTDPSDHSTFVPVAVNDILTPDQLEGLNYLTDASGTHGGGVFSYSVSDGTTTVTGSMALNDVAEEPPLGPPFLLFSAIPSGEINPVLFGIDPTDPSGQPQEFFPPFTDITNVGEEGGFAHFQGDLLAFADFPGQPDTLLSFISGPVFDSSANPITALHDVPARFTTFDGSLYLAGNSSDGAGQLIKLSFDLSSPGPSPYTVDTIVLNHGHPAFLDGLHGGFTEMDGKLYMAAVTDTVDPTAAPNLVQIDENDNVVEISTRSAPNAAFGSDAGIDSGFFVFHDTLYFNAYSETLGDTLFKLTDGSLTPVEVSSDIQHLVGNATNFHIYHGDLYFNEFSLTDGDTLFKLDATGSLTTISGPGGVALNDAGATGFGDLNGNLYFSASTDGNPGDADLYKLDSGGTVTKIDVGGGVGHSNAGEFGGFAMFAGALYFFADDAAHGLIGQLYRLDNTDTATAVDAGADGPILSSFEDAHFTQFGDNLMLRAFTSLGDELVEIDPDGTAHVGDINTDPTGNSSPGKVGGFGLYPITTLTGTDGNDILVGCDTIDSLNGGAGDDLLMPREMNDIVTGGDGADIFQFVNRGFDDVDLVTDYTFVDGDRIDVRELLTTLSNYDPGSPGFDDITNYIRVVQFETGLVVQTDLDGTGTDDTWDPVALLEGNNTPLTQHVNIIVPTGTIDFTAVIDQAPTITLTAGDITATEQVPVIVDGALTVGDVDSALLASAFVEVTDATYVSGDDLTVDVSGTNIHVSGGSGSGVLYLTGVDTVANYEKVLQSIAYVAGSDAPGTTARDVIFTVNDGTSDSVVATRTIQVNEVNDPPSIDFGGASPTQYTENGAPVQINGSVLVDDPDAIDFNGGRLTASFQANGTTADQLSIANNGTGVGQIGISGGNVTFEGNAIGTFSGGANGTDLVINFTTADAGFPAVEALLAAIQYANSSDNPSTLDRTVRFTLVDGAGTAHGGHDTGFADAIVQVTAVDDPPVAKNDAVSTNEDALLSGSVLANNGSGPDDPDGPNPTVTAVNGSAVSVGQQITLGSGAKLTLNADGTFSYDPNGAFDNLHLAAQISGASNTHTSDSFTYTISGGTSATVTVTVNGVDRPDTIYVGTGGSDTITGGSGGHLFDLTQLPGGTDNVLGGSGNDGFKLGVTLDPTDHIDGGGGTNNQVQVDGEVYSGGMTLSGEMLANIQVLAMVGGVNHNYKFTTTDSLVAAGQTFTFWSVALSSSNFVDIDGHAETNGKFNFYLGQGNDIAKGGAGNDLFYGEGGQDTLTGGGGSDTFAYLQVSDSTSTSFDILDFNAAQDKIHLPFSVAGVNFAVSAVNLDAGSFDNDLSNALGPDELGPNCAVLVNPDSGSYAGAVFLVVDANGLPGYQATEDYVFKIADGTGLSTSNFI